MKRRLMDGLFDLILSTVLLFILAIVGTFILDFIHELITDESGNHEVFNVFISLFILHYTLQGIVHEHFKEK